MNFNYSFPAVKGMQAGRKYYIAMVPIKMISRLFPFDDEYVEPEYRAQRRINQARIPEIKKYVIENRYSYVFSALAASIDGDFEFEESELENLGLLKISMDAKLLINDGQHRKAALLEAVEVDKSLEDETISIVFFEDEGLEKSQQMFTDLNKHAVKTSNSIAELYDSRDGLAVATRNMVSEVGFLNEYVDKERDILGKFSSSLFTLNTFYTANKRILNRREISEEYENFIISYWTVVSKHMIPWIELQNKELSKMDLREHYIASQAVVIQALGKVGAYFFGNAQNMEDKLERLEEINWKRTWTGWKLRVIRANGRMINNETAISLAANVIKKSIGIKLNEDEQEQERKFIESIK